jgi:hypothetical protein
MGVTMTNPYPKPAPPADNYYVRELDAVTAEDDGLDPDNLTGMSLGEDPAAPGHHYRLKVTNGLGGETKWLTVTPAVLDTLRGALATLTND